MKPSVRIPLLLLVTAVALSLGVAGVHAATQCVQFIQKKVPHHKVSAATAARWRAWDKAHPNWHPKTPRETLAQLNFACAVPLIEKPAIDEKIPSLDLTAFDLPMDLLPPPDDTPVTVAMNTVPLDPLTDDDQSTSDIVSPPIYAPQYPGLFGSFPTPPKSSVVPPAGVAPEPSSWMLLGTSVLAMGILTTRRRQFATVIARR